MQRLFSDRLGFLGVAMATVATVTTDRLPIVKSERLDGEAVGR